MSIPETHEFEVTMRLRGKLNECTLTAVTPDGKKETETVYIYAPEAMQFQVVTRLGIDWFSRLVEHF